MASVSTRLGWCVAVALLAGCFVDLDDRAGRACDEASPCREPRRCIAGGCFADDELDAGPSDGGGAGGGATFDAGSPGGGAAGGAPDAGPVDAGPQPVWQQRLHGFSDVTQDNGCTATIDPSRGNLVVASVMSSRDNEDTASANVLSPARLPQGAAGRLRGRLTLGGTPRLSGNAPFVELGAQPNRVHLQLAITAADQLEVSSQAMTVADTAVSTRYAVDGGWQRGDYLFEVRWQRGGTRTVWLNGARLGEVTLVSTAAPAPADRLRLGVMRVDGADGGPFSVTLNSWQLADDPDLALGDVP